MSGQLIYRRLLPSTVLISALLAGVARARGGSELTTCELQQKLLRSNTRIRAWYVEYESVRETAAGTPTDYAHRIVAAAAPDSFFHWSSHGGSGAHWREDPYQPRLVMTAGSTVIERPFCRQFRHLELRADAPLPGTMPKEFLFLALGWWPLANRPAPMWGGLGPCVLPGIAACPKYQVKPHLELVDGHWCHLLEYPGHDRLWIDSKRGCAIVARELLDPERAVVVQRVESSDHREVEHGIWVPFTFRNMLFRRTRAKSDEGTVRTLDATLKVLDVRLNSNVPVSLFRFAPLPGGLESVGNRTEQAVAGGSEYLDEIVQWAKHRFPFDDSISCFGGWELLVDASIAGIGAMGLMTLWLRSRPRRETANKRASANEPLSL